MHSLIKLVELSIENSAYFLGDYMFTNILGPVMNAALNHYKFMMWFPSLVPGQYDKYAVLNLDYRQTFSP
jgi:hypothetical protein